MFHLFTILVNVVEPDAIKIWRTLLWNRCCDSSSTLRKHWAVRSLVTCHQKKLLFYFIACSKTLQLKSLIISSMFSHFRPYFCLVCVFFLSYWANNLNSSTSWSCLSTSKSLIRIIMMRLARSKLSFSKTEQNSNRCERAKLKGVWVSLDPNTPLTIWLCGSYKWEIVRLQMKSWLRARFISSHVLYIPHFASSTLHPCEWIPQMLCDILEECGIQSHTC